MYGIRKDDTVRSFLKIPPKVSKKVNQYTKLAFLKDMWVWLSDVHQLSVTNSCEGQNPKVHQNIDYK